MMAMVPASLSQAIDRLHAEISERVGAELLQSDRAKVLVLGVVALLLISLTIALSAAADRAQATYRSTQLAYARLKTQVEGASWPERRAQSEALKLMLEERFWIANTPGLAEAGFERWLRDHLSRYKLEPQQIQVRRVPVAPASPGDVGARGPLTNMERMTAKITMPFDQTGLLSFLDDVAEAEHAVVVDRMIVRAGRNARVEIDVTAFYPPAEKVR